MLPAPVGSAESCGNEVSVVSEAPLPCAQTPYAHILNEKEGETRVEIVKEFYNALSLRKLSLATPILANLRIPHGNLSSCFTQVASNTL